MGILRTSFSAILLCTIGTANSFADDDKLSLEWDSSGYFRSRAITLTNLAPVDDASALLPTGVSYEIPEIRRTSYLTSRLRMTPQLRYGDKAKLNFQIDALDDVLWGDNNGLAAAPLFATDTTDQYYLGGQRDALRLHKAWVEFKIPVGIMRVGRMPNHWGMGLLANGGGNANLDMDPARPKHIAQRRSLDHYFDDDFGDNHFGSVADRILFITKPLSIAKALSGKKDIESKLVMGYAFDKISEAPLLSAESEGYNFRPQGQQGFLSRPGDDVDEHVVFAVWNDPYEPFAGPLARDTDELRIGVQLTHRRSKRGTTQPSDVTPGDDDFGSKVYIADAWARLRYGPFYGETEAMVIAGNTFGGIPFPSTNEEKEAFITGGALRLGYFGVDSQMRPKYEALVEAGHAGGDDAISDGTFRQRALHPDFNVGLILYEEVLRELSARTYGPGFVSNENPNGAIGFFSNGGVINSNYVAPKLRYHFPNKKVSIVGHLLFAWVDTLATGGPAMFWADDTDSSYLGTEFDLAIKAQFSGSMHLSLEAGYLRYGAALKSQLPNAEGSATLQSRIAFLW